MYDHLRATQSHLIGLLQTIYKAISHKRTKSSNYCLTRGQKQSCRVQARAFILSEFRQCNAISQSKYSSCLKLKFQGNHGAPHQDQTITCGISLDAFLQTFPLSLLLRIFNTENILTSGKHDTGHR